jgi:hypothetical protein
MNSAVWVKEPDPVKNNLPAVWDLVLSDLELSRKNLSNAPQYQILDLLIADIHLRDITGEKKYGVRLQPFNGRKNLKDAYEEFLDAVVYLRAEYFEMTSGEKTEEIESYARSIGVLYTTALDASLKLRYLMELKKEQNG